MQNKTKMGLLVGLGLFVGGVATLGLQVFAAQTATPTTVQAPQVQSQTATANDPKDLPGSDTDNVQDTNHQGHRPLGGDGIVASVSGTTVTMAEESNEGAALYTVDASNATITNNGAAASLSDIKVGEKIFVEGTTTGTSVVATSISLGHPGWHKEKGNDANEGSETNDSGSTSTQ